MILLSSAPLAINERPTGCHRTAAYDERPATAPLAPANASAQQNAPFSRPHNRLLTFPPVRCGGTGVETGLGCMLMSGLVGWRLPSVTASAAAETLFGKRASWHHRDMLA
jgi:hypothetical protein